MASFEKLLAWKNELVHRSEKPQVRENIRRIVLLVTMASYTVKDSTSQEMWYLVTDMCSIAKYAVKKYTSSMAKSLQDNTVASQFTQFCNDQMLISVKRMHIHAKSIFLNSFFFLHLITIFEYTI